MTEKKTLSGAVRKRITDADGDVCDARELFGEYARYGGMPMLADVGLEPDRVAAALDGVYSAAVVNDILERERRKCRGDFLPTVSFNRVLKSPGNLQIGDIHLSGFFMIAQIAQMDQQGQYIIFAVEGCNIILKTRKINFIFQA